MPRTSPDRILATINQEQRDRVPLAISFSKATGLAMAVESRILAECLRLLQSITDVPICIDSSIIDSMMAILFKSPDELS